MSRYACLWPSPAVPSAAAAASAAAAIAGTHSTCVAARTVEHARASNRNVAAARWLAGCAGAMRPIATTASGRASGTAAAAAPDVGACVGVRVCSRLGDDGPPSSQKAPKWVLTGLVTFTCEDLGVGTA
jgi:hypothetical protein